MIQIEFDMLVFKEDASFVAYCSELDISSCGNTVEHAKEMLKTAIKLFLEEAEKMGTLEDILEETNYKKDTSGKCLFREDLLQWVETPTPFTLNQNLNQEVVLW